MNCWNILKECQKLEALPFFKANNNHNTQFFGGFSCLLSCVTRCYTIKSNCGRGITAVPCFESVKLNKKIFTKENQFYCIPYPCNYSINLSILNNNLSNLFSIYLSSLLSIYVFDWTCIKYLYTSILNFDFGKDKIWSKSGRIEF